MSATWYREPLLHFLVLGGVVFGLDAARSPEPPPTEEATRVVPLDAAARARAREDFRKRTGREPTAEEEQATVQRALDEEILFRRALELGLDRNDLIVRRRLVQKMRFLIEDVHPVAEPGDEALDEWLASHDADYRVPQRVSFEQVFFSRSARGDQLESDAQAALAVLRADPAAKVGDPFYLGTRFVERSADELAGSFGRGFADAVMALPPGGGWAGPTRSSFGAHLVRVTEVQAPRSATVDEVRPRLARDLKRHLREQANEAALERLRALYRVQTL